MKPYYDKFRGDSKIISARMHKYLRYFGGCRNVIDLGCGKGEFVSLLRENGINTIGIDSDPDMIKIGKDGGLSVMQGDALGFLRERKSFDGIMASHLIEHLDPKLAEVLLKNAFDFLEPNGKIVIITPNIENLAVATRGFWLDNTHVRPYPLELLIEMVIAAGFKIEDSGGDIDTLSHRLIDRIRKRIMEFFFRLMGIPILNNGIYSALDIFVVGIKK